MSASPQLQPLRPQRPMRSVGTGSASILRPLRSAGPKRRTPWPKVRPTPSRPTQSRSNPSRLTRSRRSPRRRQPSAPHAGLAAETLLKLLVNGVLSVAAVITLLNLFPYYWAQQAKLQEVRQQVQTTEQEVSGLQQDFNRSFDPSQARSVMQDQSGLLAPNQRRVVLTNEDAE
ncbi:MAG: hypothetical protein AAGG51_02580 [Cyanobacteria bacterium P01_G01_bin.54]